MSRRGLLPLRRKNDVIESGAAAGVCLTAVWTGVLPAAVVAASTSMALSVSIAVARRSFALVRLITLITPVW